MTLDEIQAFLTYDPITGILVWLPRSDAKWDARWAGKEAGWLRRDGYREIVVEQFRARSHRIAWAIHHGSWPTNFIDHINGDRHDNRIANLREATKQENNQNCRASGKSGIKGAYKVGKRWRAQLKGKHLGYFDTAEEANAVFLKAASRDYGAFARG